MSTCRCDGPPHRYDPKWCRVTPQNVSAVIAPSGALVQASQQLAAAQGRVAELTGAVDRVRALHRRGSLHVLDQGNVCIGCGAAWPCATTLALGLT